MQAFFATNWLALLSIFIGVAGSKIGTVENCLSGQA